MSTVANSFTKAKSWFRNMLVDDNSLSSSVPVLNLTIEDEQTPIEKTDMRFHSAPETPIFATSTRRSHMHLLKAACANAFGELYSSFDKGGSARSSISLHLGSDYNGSNASEDAQYTSNMQDFDEPPTTNESPLRFETQQSVLSKDSGIYMENDFQQESHESRKSTMSDRLRPSAANSIESKNRYESQRSTSSCIDFTENTNNERNHFKSIEHRNRFYISKHSRSSELGYEPELKTISGGPIESKRKSKSKKKTSKESYGRIKISLQYFEDGEQLRIIVIRADKLRKKACDVEARLSLLFDNVTMSESTPVARVKDNDVQFKKDIYMNTSSDGLEGAELCVRLYKVTKFFRRRKAIGEARIFLEDVDLTMDTTLWFKLSPASSKRFRKKVNILTYFNSQQNQTILKQ